MNIRFAKLQDADVHGKVVLVRVDHNVLKNGEIKDPERINRTIGTLYNIVERGGRLILMSHVGRPKGADGKIRINDQDSVKPIVRYLENRLYTKFVVPKINYGKPIETIDTSINILIRNLRKRKIGGIYLPNTRWFSGEESGGKEEDILSKQLAGLADIFVNDAFGSWQPHASTCGVAKYLPSYAGYLMQYEVENLKSVLKPKKPMMAVIAGMKFDTKIETLTSIIDSVDYLLLGGHIYNTYIAAKYDLDIQGVQPKQKEQAKKFIEAIGKNESKILIIETLIEADKLASKDEAKWKEVKLKDLQKGQKLGYLLDAAPCFVEQENIKKAIADSKTIFVNAVMGFSPYYLEGSKALYNAIDKNKKAHKLYGGGDTNQEFKLGLPTLFRRADDDPNYYFFTGGGTILKVLESRSINNLAPIRALIESNENIKRGYFE